MPGYCKGRGDGGSRLLSGKERSRHEVGGG